jgi:hypothetical protein
MLRQIQQGIESLEDDRLKTHLRERLEREGVTDGLRHELADALDALADKEDRKARWSESRSKFHDFLGRTSTRLFRGKRGADLYQQRSSNSTQRMELESSRRTIGDDEYERRKEALDLDRQRLDQEWKDLWSK